MVQKYYFYNPDKPRLYQNDINTGKWYTDDSSKTKIANSLTPPEQPKQGLLSKATSFFTKKTDQPSLSKSSSLSSFFGRKKGGKSKCKKTLRKQKSHKPKSRKQKLHQQKSCKIRRNRVV